MNENLTEAYTLECGLILTWLGEEESSMPTEETYLPVWASRKISDLLRREFTRRNDLPPQPGERRIFAQGLWCQIYSPSDYIMLDIAFQAQKLVASLVATASQDSIYGGINAKVGTKGNAVIRNKNLGIASAVRVVPIGLLGTGRELVRVQQGKSSPLVFSAIATILRKAFKISQEVSFMCLPRFFFGEELSKTALLLEDLLKSDDDLSILDSITADDHDPVFV